MPAAVVGTSWTPSAPIENEIEGKRCLVFDATGTGRKPLQQWCLAVNFGTINNRM